MKLILKNNNHDTNTDIKLYRKNISFSLNNDGTFSADIEIRETTRNRICRDLCIGFKGCYLCNGVFIQNDDIKGPIGPLKKSNEDNCPNHYVIKVVGEKAREIKKRVNPKAYIKKSEGE